MRRRRTPGGGRGVQHPIVRPNQQAFRFAEQQSVGLAERVAQRVAVDLAEQFAQRVAQRESKRESEREPEH